jgi:hypothetical protein
MIGLKAKAAKWIFIGVMAVGITGIGIFIMKTRDDAIAAAAKARCEQRVAAARAKLIAEHAAAVTALQEKISALEAEVNRKADELQKQSVAALDDAMKALPDRPCLTKAVNEAIAKRIRKRH